MVVYENIYFEAYTNDQYIGYRNNTAKLYSILGEPSYIGCFLIYLRIALIFRGFPTGSES